MLDLESVRFEIQLSGEPLVIQGVLSLRTVVGQWAAPDSSQAILGLQAGDISTEIASISIGGRQWATNPVNGDWDELPPGFAFDPAVLFDAETGWRALLTENLGDAELSGLEVTDAGPRYRLRGRASGERIETLTQGFAGSDPVDVELWVDPATGLLTRLFFVTAGTEWALNLSEFDEPVTIEPPDTGI